MNVGEIPICGILALVCVTTLSADYSWRGIYETSMSTCMRSSQHYSPAQALKQTILCFSLFWTTCLNPVQMKGLSYTREHVCMKLSLMSPILVSDKQMDYRIQFDVPLTYTINATFTKFNMDRSPFGCDRNKMQLVDGMHNIEYCGVRHHWSNYTATNTLIIRIMLHGIGAHFHVDLTCMVLDIIQGTHKYRQNPAREVNIYRGHRKYENYTLDQLLISWDPAKVALMSRLMIC